MKRTVLVVAMVIAAGTWATATSQNGVIFIGHEKVAAGGTIVTTPSVIVQLNRRTETGMSEVHDKETDTFHVLSGSATFVTGGEMVESKLTAPGQYRGSSLRGGTEHHLTKGDVMVIPAGVPHWFKTVTEPIEYYVVKALAP